MAFKTCINSRKQIRVFAQDTKIDKVKKKEERIYNIETRDFVYLLLIQFSNIHLDGVHFSQKQRQSYE